MNISEKINILDETFSSYLLNKNEKVCCKNIAVALKAFSSDKEFKVSIIRGPSMSKESFFGMRIFPSEEALTELCEAITNSDNGLISLNDMCKRWRTIEKWEVEIDSRVFDRYAISFNPQEITAMLLHEVGHTIYSDKKIEMFYRVYKECRVRMKTSQKASAKLLCFFYLIPLTLVCGIRDWSITSDDLKEEIFADQSVQKLGYGEHLISAYEKIIHAYGDTTGYYDNSRKEAAISQSITWCNLNISDLVHRKNKLKDELYETGIKTNSSYIHKVISTILNKISATTMERHTGNIVMESLNFDNDNFVNEYKIVYDLKGFNKLTNMINSVCESANNSVAMEAFGKKKAIDVPSQLEVDTIFVEIDRIENHADRRYVLDLIYNQEEKINKFIELFEYNPELKSKYNGKMKSMLKELESMRLAVLNKRSFDKQYKVFVKYPEGYEG